MFTVEQALNHTMTYSGETTTMRNEIKECINGGWEQGMLTSWLQQWYSEELSYNMTQVVLCEMNNKEIDL